MGYCLELLFYDKPYILSQLNSSLILVLLIFRQKAKYKEKAVSSLFIETKNVSYMIIPRFILYLYI